ncbi:hypothetical protein KIN20_000265 [Parelaphostrongylus tenuis]|uniref:Uncharacterized protein n=1 Tax=Parelaphostrongylus tenuis TaxID=148309 RepID=A0AAD5MDD2_PARTN|nr:hypothetical protein KIN20_000265 [Parelaphostrongylus tenuis]
MLIVASTSQEVRIDVIEFRVVPFFMLSIATHTSDDTSQQFYYHNGAACVGRGNVPEVSAIIKFC